MYLRYLRYLPTTRRYFSAQTKKEPGPEVWMQGLRERICFLPGMQFACPSMHVEGDDVQALYNVGKKVPHCHCHLTRYWYTQTFKPCKALTTLLLGKRPLHAAPIFLGRSQPESS